MKTTYGEKPATLLDAGNGNTYYHFNIEEITVNDTIQWQCDRVEIKSVANAESVKQAVIEELWGGGKENKLINDYLEATATGENQKAIDDYNAFLAERHAVKEDINAYFAGIC